MKKSLMLVLSLLAVTVLGTDTAFWKPYKVDDLAYGLYHFDSPGLVKAEGECRKGQTTGNASFEEKGKFGRALKLAGDGSVQFSSDCIFPGSLVSMEGWVKLNAYPADKGYVVLREYKKGESKGFALWIDSKGAVHMSVTDLQGDSSTVATDPGVVPLNKWVHLAAISSYKVYFYTFNIIYVDGKELAKQPIPGGRGLMDDKTKEEKTATPIIIGQGINGLLDEVRVHRKIMKFWEKPEFPWISRVNGEAFDDKCSWVMEDHKPVLYFPLDENTTPKLEGKKVKITAKEPVYKEGVKGKGLASRLTISAADLLTIKEGTFEFWLSPYGVNNCSDKNWSAVSCSGFNAYTFNGGKIPFTFSYYFNNKEGKMVMTGDSQRRELYPGNWYHLVFTWGKNEICMFINGELVGKCAGDFENKYNKGKFTGIDFNSSGKGPFGIVDEVYVYDKKLSPTEIANCYNRYVNPAKVNKDLRPNVINLQGWYLPSFNTLYYKVSSDVPAAELSKINFKVKDEAGKEFFSQSAKLTDTYGKFIIPDLPNGKYNFFVDYEYNGKAFKSNSFNFERIHFPWEGNKLGITDEIYKPYEPVKVNGNEVSTVQRKYRMNDFGFWSSVISKGKEILAGPITLNYRTVSGKTENWTTSGSFKSSTPQLAVYEGSAESAPLKVKTVSEIEMDGMMKVTMEMMPGKEPEEIEKLWLEVPLKNEIVKLLHEDTACLRRNYAGSVKQGDGVIWSSSNSYRSSQWQNCFTGYVWVGEEERGFAWFGENDKGWITEKNNSKKPLQEIIRQGDKVYLRVYFINKPAKVEKTHKLVFGMQVSPTKPVPEDWRIKALTLGGCGLAVHPWGGLSCAWKYPYKDKWEVVDKVIEGQRTGKVDKKWFEDFQKKHDVPKVAGTNSWVGDVCRFAGKRRLESPVLVYFEEMMALPIRKEWHVFQDEWSLNRIVNRNWPDMSIYRKGVSAGAGVKINFITSYQDHGLYYENEWMKRGVSMYWDNTYLKVSVNPWTSAAYQTEDGTIQPATTLWNQRDYMKRTWNLMHYWRTRQDKPLEFCAHMTNTNLLPLFSWSTISFELELGKKGYSQRFPDHFDPDKPYPPDFIRAESIGLKVGNYSYLVHGLFQYQLGKDTQINVPEKVFNQEREWGLRMVHEINRGGPGFYHMITSQLERAVYGFGYGVDKDVKVFRYWGDDAPALTVDSKNVKWILLSKERDKALMLVLQSWSETPEKISFTLNPKVIGFEPGKYVMNAQDGKKLQLDGNTVKVDMDGPYAMKIIRFTQTPWDKEGELFSDNFTDDADLRWTYISHFLKTHADKDGKKFLRFAKNEASWRGVSRIAKWDETTGWRNYDFSFKFRMGKMPEKSVGVFSVCVRGELPTWSRYGLSHTYLTNGEWLTLKADGVKKVWSLDRSIVVDNKRSKRISKISDIPLDGNWHEFSVSVNGAQTTVKLDGKEILTCGDTPDNGGAIAIHTDRDLDKTVDYLDISDVSVKGVEDYSRNIPIPVYTIKGKVSAKDSPEVVELKTSGVFDEKRYKQINRLLLFSRPVENAEELIKICRGIKNPAWEKYIISMLSQIKTRKELYVKEMKDIGQPTPELPQYEKAEKMIEAFLKPKEKK
jgi:hypothetical protein